MNTVLANGRPGVQTPQRKRRYGMIPPGSAVVGADGRVNLANADMDWARFAPNGGALVAINAQRRLVGLFATTGGAHHPPATVKLHTHALNTSCRITRELNAIGVDLGRVVHATVGVIRVRRAGCGTRYLVLRFPPEALKGQARRNKHG